MPDFQVTDPATPLPGEQGQHYELIKQAIPTCLVNSSPSSPQGPQRYGAGHSPLV